MGSSKCANMGEASPGHIADTRKKILAKTLNQGLGETCTIHALANAVTQSLWTRSNIEVSPEECLGGLKQLEKVEVFGGNHVEDFHEEVVKNMTDQITGAYGDVQIHVTRLPRGKKGKGVTWGKSETGCQYVLVYDREEGDPETKHCVYIQELSKSDPPMLSCLNSWGRDNQENPEISVFRRGNIFYSISAEWTPVIGNGQRHITSHQSEEGITGRMQRGIFGTLMPTNLIFFKTILFGKVYRLNFVMGKAERVFW